MTYNHFDYLTDTIYSDARIHQRFDDDGSGRITATWAPFWRWLISDNWDVLETDYNNYAIIYSCNDVFFSYYREVTVLSRTPRISDTYLEYIQTKIIDKVGQSVEKIVPYRPSRLQNVNHGGWCQYALDTGNVKTTNFV